MRFIPWKLLLKAIIYIYDIQGVESEKQVWETMFESELSRACNRYLILKEKERGFRIFVVHCGRFYVLLNEDALILMFNFLSIPTTLNTLLFFYAGKTDM